MQGVVDREEENLSSSGSLFHGLYYHSKSKGGKPTLKYEVLPQLINFLIPLKDLYSYPEVKDQIN